MEEFLSMVRRVQLIFAPEVMYLHMRSAFWNQAFSLQHIAQAASTH